MPTVFREIIDQNNFGEQLRWRSQKCSEDSSKKGWSGFIVKCDNDWGGFKFANIIIDWFTTKKSV